MKRTIYTAEITMLTLAGEKTINIQVKREGDAEKYCQENKGLLKQVRYFERNYELFSFELDELLMNHADAEVIEIAALPAPKKRNNEVEE